MPSDISNFANDIKAAAGGEVIEAVVIDGEDNYTFNTYSHQSADERDIRCVPPEVIGKTLTWAQAEPLLNYSYNTGFGHQDCHDVTVWTANRVLYVHEYDGATSIQYVKRNPPA